MPRGQPAPSRLPGAAARAAALPSPLRLLRAPRAAREGRRTGRPPCVCGERRGSGAAVPSLGPPLSAAFPIVVSRNRKVPVQLAPIRSCLPPPDPLPLPLPASGACERSRCSPCGTGLSCSGQPPMRRGMGTGLCGPSGRAQLPALSQQSVARRARLP